MPESKLWDVIIIGGGPAGLAAALYAARDRYATLLLEKNGLPGGQIMLTESIENYPGYPRVSGFDLVQKMQEQVTAFGTDLRTNRAVTSLTRRDDGTFSVLVNHGEETHTARSVILAPGSDYRQLGVPGEAQMRQATRVSYCATCDGAFYRDKHVLTVGGGNTAVEDTVYLATRFAQKVTMIHRRREFRAQKVLIEELHEAADGGKIDIRLPYVLEEIVPTDDGKDIDHVLIRNMEQDRAEKLHVDGVFIFVGMVPNTKFLQGFIELDEAGYVPANPQTMHTAIPGVFIAGDCRQHAPLQLITACADGVVAAMQLKQYFRDPSSWATVTEPTPEGKGW